MSSIFLSTEVTVELFLELLLLVTLSYAVVQALLLMKLMKHTTRELQDSIDKKSYLVTTLVSVSFIIKILLLAFFTYTLDELSSVIPGAMCVSGVLDSNMYGSPLLLLKISVLFVTSLWLVMNKESFQKKMFFFLFLYVAILAEFILSIVYFSSIPTETVVSCCSTKYISVENPIPFNLNKEEVVQAFFAMYILIMFSAYQQQKVILLLSSTVFMYTSYYAIVYYFGAFIYGYETHKCPFCMLKQEYYFIGYFIYIFLFSGMFYTLEYILFKSGSKQIKKIMISFTLSVLFIIIYYLLSLF